MYPHTIAIIGDGASGTLLATQLLRSTQQPLHIFLIDPRPLIGRGVAYSTTNVHHLLNVPVSKMSAYSEFPDHFLHWLMNYAENTRAIGDTSATSFVPRYMYGLYLQNVLEEAKAANSKSVLEQVQDEVLAVCIIESGVKIVVKSGRCLSAHQVILATGNSEPHHPFVETPDFYTSNRYSYNPWSPEAITAISSSASVLFLGSSLTMIDIALALKAQGHTGPLFAVSRRGVVPSAHRTSALSTIQLPSHDFPKSLRASLRWFREMEQTVMQEEGGDWRSIVDALRPHIQILWQSWSVAEKQQFLRHVQPYWDARRHRIAPMVAAAVAQMRATEQLQVYAGRVQRYDETDEDVAVMIRLRRLAEPLTLRVQHVINCTGPGCDIRKSKSPLLANLFSQGLIRPDPCYLGIDTTTNGAVIGYDGATSPFIYTLGPLRKGTLWETTAIPEIRIQAEQLAQLLLYKRDS